MLDLPDSLRLSLDDLQLHVVKYGVDCFPPPDVRTEVTRAHDLFERLQAKWPRLYQKLVFRPEAREFKIMANYSTATGSAELPAFELTQRGAVFVFPQRLPQVGSVNEALDLDGVFDGSLQFTRSTFPGVQVLRVGIIQEAIFGTGQTDVIPYLASRFGGFPGAMPKGGSALVAFKDDKCNIRVKMETLEIHRRAETPTRQVMSDEMECGLKVELDVNNIAMRPQEASDIESTLQRAHSLWPKELLQFINWRGDDNDHRGD